MPVARTRYQQGTVEKSPRKKGPDVWVYRWRERTDDGVLKSRKQIIGTINDFSTQSLARREATRLQALANTLHAPSTAWTIDQAWEHFKKFELASAGGRREVTTILAYLGYFRLYILPRWGKVQTDDVKAVDVERWLGSLSHLTTKKPYSDGTKAKIRNLMSALFNHLMRYEIYCKPLNPISKVRQGAERTRDPEVLSLTEIKALLSHLENQAVHMMVLQAATTALRRSEIRGLRWGDIDTESNWLNLQRGLVSKDITKLKTRASRKGVPLLPAMTLALSNWRKSAIYCDDHDWVFASPFTKGLRPYWLDVALAKHVKPAARSAGITKAIGWHTFRHSLATNLGNNSIDPKVVQEILRHASVKITMDVYQQGNQQKKRHALDAMSDVFLSQQSN